MRTALQHHRRRLRAAHQRNLRAQGLMDCPSCEGTGEIDVTRDCSPSEATGGLSELTGQVRCDRCEGKGVVSATPAARM